MFRAMIQKEFLLVFRDKHALLALFVMPAIFILIMSVAMKDQFSTNSIEFKVFVKDSDNTNVSKKILKNIEEDKKFQIVSNTQDAEFFIKIPQKFEEEIESKISLSVQGAIKNNQITAFKAILLEDILHAKLDTMAEHFKNQSAQAEKALQNLKISSDAIFSTKYNSSIHIPNATQQSVPAWIVFGMFFVIIPMSTIYVNERKQNTLARLHSMNVSIVSMSISKAIPYMVINQIQVVIMLGVGKYLVPLFDTPALLINGSLIALGAISIALSSTAIGISSLIAVSAKSSEQATTIGGILNILLGAIGGVMVPKFIMPETMQKLTELSPMSWGLDGFLDIFLLSADLSMILSKVTLLFSFGVGSLIISMLILDYRIKKGI